MRGLLSIISIAACSSLLFSSCFKEEKAHPINNPVHEGEYDIVNGAVSIGEDYNTQVYFSFGTGVVSSGPYRSWDISFTTGADNPELWMNGGKNVLIYPTGKSDYTAVTTLGSIAENAWKYDNPNGLQGQSGLGILNDKNHLGEVLIVDGGDDLYFKLQILEITASHYLIKTGPLEAAVGSEYTLNKDDNYNFVFYSFSDGIVQPEPPKKDWDLLFTRYRHIYYHYNPDGSDKPYAVNGVLTNPYKTESGEDSTHGHEFDTFSLDSAKTYTLKPDRDIIGFDWKTPDINTAQYTVNPRALFIIKDQQEALWKLHFISFYGSDGKKGTPQFELQRLQ